MTTSSGSAAASAAASSQAKRLRAEADRLLTLVDGSARAKLWEETYRREHPTRVMAQGFRQAADFLEGIKPQKAEPQDRSQGRPGPRRTS